MLNNFKFPVTLLVCFICLICFAVITGQTAQIPPFVSDEKGSQHHWGVLDLNLSTQKINYAYQADHQFSPASLLKLISTTFLLEHFPDSILRPTHVGYDGLIVNDTVLYGNLILKAGGDPLLGAESTGGDIELSQAIILLKKKKIRFIRGNIIIDYSNLPETASNMYSTLEDRQWWYGAPSCGISYHQNYLELDLMSEGDSVNTALTPHLFDCTIRSSVRIGSDVKPEIIVYLNDNLREIILKGVFPQSLPLYRIKLAVPNPPLFMASLIKQKLLESGITHQGKIEFIRDSQSLKTIDYQNLMSFHSHKLPDILKIANRESSNFIFEQLFALYSFNQAGISGDNFLPYYLDMTLKLKIPRSGYCFLDYSGLSAYNYITPAILGQFIQSVYLKKDLWNRLVQTLPRSDQVEPFKHLLPDSTLIKTGTLKNSCSLCALVRDDGQDRLFLFWVERVPEHEISTFFSQMAAYIRKNLED